MFYRFLCAILMLLWGGAALAQAAERAAEQSTVTIPLKGAGAFGSAFNMHAEVFKPAGQGPFPVMVYAHGRSGTQQERNALREVIPREYLRFWIDRGFAARSGWHAPATGSAVARIARTLGTPGRGPATAGAT